MSKRELAALQEHNQIQDTKFDGKSSNPDTRLVKKKVSFDFNDFYL